MFVCNNPLLPLSSKLLITQGKICFTRGKVKLVDKMVRPIELLMWDGGNYCIRAYLSFIQHRNPNLKCVMKVIVLS